MVNFLFRKHFEDSNFIPGNFIYQLYHHLVGVPHKIPKLTFTLLDCCSKSCNMEVIVIASTLKLNHI